MSTHNPKSGQTSPNPDPKAHSSDPSVREGFEVTDANTGGIAVFLVSLFVSVIVFFGVCYVIGIGINRGLDNQDGPVNKWAAQNQVAPRMAIQSSPVLQQQQLSKLTQQFPTPRLETDDGNQDLTELHGREDLLLNHYSWIDRSAGTVRIPIERAMELIAQRGLPVAPADQQQTAMSGDSRPQVQMPLTDGFARTAYEQAQHSSTEEAGEQASSKANNQ
jgi:hypothetical protein